MLPGASTLPHVDPRWDAKVFRHRFAHRRDGPRRNPARGCPDAGIVSPALLALAAVGGSTNAVIHLGAIAGRRLLNLTVEDFDAAARMAPVLADVVPIGRHNIAAFDAADGIQVVLAELGQTGPPDQVTTRNRNHNNVIRRRDDPVTMVPAFTVLRGNLGPDGAVPKTAAAREELTTHTGPAVVFHGYDDMLARIDDPDLNVDENSVLMLIGCGPRGGDGFPEWGMISIPKKLAERRVTDMVRIGDARMSGTTFGTCVLHVAPEAAVGGPLAAVENGDLVTLDVRRHLLHVEVPPDVLSERSAQRTAIPNRHLRGWPALYQRHVMQAPPGADLDFLVPANADELEFIDPIVVRS